MLTVPDPDAPCGLEVPLVQLAQQSCSVAAELLAAPLASLDLFDMALVEAQAQLLQLLPNTCGAGLIVAFSNRPGASTRRRINSDTTV